MNNNQYDTLVFSGGGLRGFAFIGCQKSLEERRIIGEIETFAGCSIGAVFAAIMAAGYTSEELYDFILNFTYNDVRNIKILNFLTSYGLETGDKILEFLRIMLKRKTGFNNITFEEFYKLTRKHLIINATCLNDHKVVYFDHISHPEMPVVLALRMSISLPFLMAPVSYKGKLYVDGGVMDNFPVHLFKNPERVLGFKLTNDYPPVSKIDNFESFVRHTWSCIYGELNRVKLEGLVGYQLILIDISYVHTFNLYLTQEQRIEMYKIGYNTSEKVFEELFKNKNEKETNKSTLVRDILEDLSKNSELLSLPQDNYSNQDRIKLEFDQVVKSDQIELEKQESKIEKDL